MKDLDHPREIPEIVSAHRTFSRTRVDLNMRVTRSAQAEKPGRKQPDVAAFVREHSAP
jgi:hypothetical protein